ALGACLPIMESLACFIESLPHSLIVARDRGGRSDAQRRPHSLFRGDVSTLRNRFQLAGLVGGRVLAKYINFPWREGLAFARRVRYSFAGIFRHLDARRMISPTPRVGQV